MSNCPISLEKPEIPVITDQGITYDFNHLANHILTHDALDPITRTPITCITLIRNQELLSGSIDIDETCRTFMYLVNFHPYLKIRGVGELSFLQPQLTPVYSFFKSLKTHTFEQGITLFHLAAHLGNLECMQALQASNIVSINQGYKDNITALHLASATSRHSIVKWLLSLDGINVNCNQYSNGITPLHIAVAKADWKLVLLLIKHHNTNIIISRLDGLTPIDFAIYHHNLKILSILLLCSYTPCPGILFADRRNDSEYIKLFLEYYLHEMIFKPNIMSKYLLTNPEIKACLDKYHEILWDLMIHPSQRLNLASKFPSLLNESDFNKNAYYDFIEKKLEDGMNKIDSANPFFTIFGNHDLQSKINFFKRSEAKNDDKIEYPAKFSHSHSMSCLNNSCYAAPFKI